MERIRQAFIKYAPPGTEFLQSPEPDALHVINWIGQNPREHTKRCEICQAAPTLPLTPKYLIMLHLDNPHYPQHEESFRKLLEGAQLIVTYHGDYVRYAGCHVLETPWGVDLEIFKVLGIPRIFTILTTGHDADQEAIEAVRRACLHSYNSVIHIGGDLRRPWISPTSHRRENVSDQELCTCYNQSLFASGLRREGGFELPTIEGYACGCQPINFDHPVARKFFDDFSMFVPNVRDEELIPHLIRCFHSYRPITPDPKILARFSWENIMARVWSALQGA